MTRRWTILLPTLLGLTLPAAAEAKPVPSASAKVAACTTGLAPAGRAFAVAGRMRALPGATRLRMRFTLQTQGADDTRWRVVAGEGLDEWRVAEPAPRRFDYLKRVEGLVVGARYRMRVTFRWDDASGAAVASARRTTGVCRQPDFRANLRPLSLQVLPGPDAASRRYVLTLRNLGRSAAGAFRTQLEVGGRPLAAVATTGLAAGAGTEVRWVGPACAAPAALVARTDFGEVVDEADESDDELTLPCPGPPGTER